MRIYTGRGVIWNDEALTTQLRPQYLQCILALEDLGPYQLLRPLWLPENWLQGLGQKALIYLRNLERAQTRYEVDLAD